MGMKHMWNSSSTVGLPTLLAAALAVVTPVCARAQDVPNLGQATLEELMAIRVTSAGRKSQKPEDVAAAVYVITRQDIRRSGLNTLPEILRLAPGVQVARVNGNKWAVSIRGFNDLYSNKLLVLVDGRSVYSRTFSGVFWDTQDLMLADIDRIEIIRGPGGTSWGANAVNGVINIITRSASDTRGLAVDASVGSLTRERAGIRYGGEAGEAAYRVYAQWSGFDSSKGRLATAHDDGWDSLTGGVRLDWSGGRHRLMGSANATAGSTRPGWFVLTGPVPGEALPTHDVSESVDLSVLGRWTLTDERGGGFQLQAFQASARRDEAVGNMRERTSDIDAQYETAIGSRHGLVVGGGYRHVDMETDGTFTLHVGARNTNTVNLFLQDEIALTSTVNLTIGSKLEHDTLGGWGLLPSARVIWEPAARQHLWAGVSRARRTPALTDLDLRVNRVVVPGAPLPVAYGFSGNPSYEAEVLVQTEAGYRAEPVRNATLNVTAFVGSYRGLPTYEPAAPVIVMTPAPHVRAGSIPANWMTARSSGVEVDAHWTPLQAVEIAGFYAFLRVTADADPASRDPRVSRIDGDAPEHQWQLRSTLTPLDGLQAGFSLFRVGELRRLTVPAYTRLDARVEYRLTHRLALAVVGQNLTRRHHHEFINPVLVPASSVPRSARFDLRWTF